MHSFCKYRSPWREQRHLELETWNSWYCWTNMQRSKLSRSKVMNCVKSARHLSALHRERHPWSPFFNIPNVDTECRIVKPRRFLKECLRQFCGGCCGDGMMSQWCVLKINHLESSAASPSVLLFYLCHSSSKIKFWLLVRAENRRSQGEEQRTNKRNSLFSVISSNFSLLLCFFSLLCRWMEHWPSVPWMEPTWKWEKKWEKKTSSFLEWRWKKWMRSGQKGELGC